MGEENSLWVTQIVMETDAADGSTRLKVGSLILEEETSAPGSSSDMDVGGDAGPTATSLWF